MYHVLIRTPKGGFRWLPAFGFSVRQAMDYIIANHWSEYRTIHAVVDAETKELVYVTRKLA